MAADSAVPNVRLQRLIRDRGLTQPYLAALVNAEYEAMTGHPGCYDAESIRRLERGEVTWPHAPYRKAFCRVFGVGEPALGFFSRRSIRRKQDPGPSASAASAAAPGQSQSVAHHSPTQLDEETDMRRIEFLRGLATLGGTWLTSGSLLDALDDAARTAATEVPKSIGSEHVNEVWSITSTFRAADHAGHAVAREAMAVQLRHAVALLEAQADHRTRIDMHVAVGQLADVIGWSHFDAGQYRAADRYFRIGLHCADTAGAWWLRAEILSDMARQAIYLRHADDALTLFGAARVREDQLSPLRRATLYAQQAHAYSALGEVRECARSVAVADQHFADHLNSRDSRDEPHFGEFDRSLPGRLADTTGCGLFDIAIHGHELDNARTRLEDAIASLPDAAVRSRVLDTARLAAITLRHGDPDHGVVLAHQALDSAEGIIRSQRVTDDITNIHRATAKLHRRHPEVARLRTTTAEFLRGPRHSSSATIKDHRT